MTIFFTITHLAKEKDKTTTARNIEEQRECWRKCCILKTFHKVNNLKENPIKTDKHAAGLCEKIMAGIFKVVEANIKRKTKALQSLAKYMYIQTRKSQGIKGLP